MDQRRLPKSTWLVTLLSAVVLGIWPGVALGQQHWIFFGAILGWVSFLSGFIALLTHSTDSNPVFWYQVLAACGYPLAMVGYSICAYRAMQRTRAMYKVFLLLLGVVCVSTLASIPAAVITMSVNQHLNVLSFFSGYLIALPTHGIILFHLCIAAGLGWWIAGCLVMLSRRAKSHSEINIRS